MPRDYEQAVIFLHSVRMGDRLYSGPSEVRAWVRGWPAEETCLQPIEVPGQRAGLGTHANDLAPIWGRAGRTDR
jgi:hypothetical protein